MKEYIKLVYNMIERSPVFGQLAYAAKASYVTTKEFQRLGYRAPPELLWSTFWNTSAYSVKNNTNAPLIIRKALAFKKILRFMEHQIEKKGLSILFGHDIPYWYPHFTLTKEGNLSEVSNLTPGFNYVLEIGLIGIMEEIQKLEGTPSKEAFVIVIESIKAFCDRIMELLSANDFEPIDGVASDDVRRWIARVPWYPPSNFQEAIFAVWLLDLFCWYDNHRLIGLGRLDQWLWPYLQRDLEQGLITETQALDSIKHFIKWLNNSRARKSNLLLGDTGQTLIVGGINSDGSENTNPLSFLFIEALKELKSPEPKLVARISSASSDKYLMRLIEMIKANLGYPLLCNDEIIIAALIQEGYSKEDARNYGVAACWEYLIPGHSFDQGNVGIISLLTPITTTIDIAIHKNIKNFEDFIDIYENQLALLIQEKVKIANSISFVPAPLLSIMYPDCVRLGQDITEGGARYNNYGFLGMGLADAADSLYVIKKAIFEDKIISLKRLGQMLKENFENDENTRLFFLNKFPKFGNDNENVDKIATHIVNIFALLTRQHKTRYGGIFRPGLGSAGEYIFTAKDIPATPNGRNKGDPCAVNLSPSPGAPKHGPTAILRSITKLDLMQMGNCAVSEISINAPSFLSPEIETDQQWLKWLVQAFVRLGGAELQFNIIDAKILRNAQMHPELYRDLLVRVWGFNAYFVELPKEFQDHLIARVESCTI